MGLFEHWPYVNFHELNLDWIIKEIPKVFAARDEAQASAEASAGSADRSEHQAANADTSAYNAAQSELNAAQSAEDAAESEANAKNYSDHIADPVTGLVTDWLNDHVTPTTPIVDDTLTIQGAAADAKKTGDEITDLNSAFDEIWITGKNLFNKDDVVDGKYISVSTGAEVALATSSASDYIEIEPDTSYTISCSALNQIRYALYDNVKAYLTGAESNASFTSPSNAKYIRFSIPTSTLNTAQLEEGNTATAYEAYYHAIAEQYIWSNELKEKIETITDPISDQISYLKDGNDLYSLKYNNGFIGGNGDITIPTANQEVYTDKVAVNEGDVIDLSLQYDTDRTMWLAYATYDENEVFINRVALINGSSSLYNGTITIGSGVSYIVFTFRSYGIATFSAYTTANFYKTLSEHISDLGKTYQPKTSVTVKSIAHRGDDIDAPQCTAPSYIIARQRGFDIAENDVWYSEDGYYVMEHDTTLARLGNMVDINGYLMYTDGSTYYWVHPTTNAVYTWDGSAYAASSVSLNTLTRCNGSNYGVNSTYANIGLNFDVLRRIDFGVYKGDKFRGTQIMTFDEWVLLCKQLGMEIYIDRKWNYTSEQIADLAGIVKKYGMGDKASWLGMDGAKIIALRNIIPNSRCCLLQHPSQALIDAYTPYNVGRGFFFNGNGKTMIEAEIQLGLNAGFDVEVWFVDYETMTEEQVLNTIRTAVAYGVTGLTLDKYRVDDAFAYLLNQY